MTGTHHRYVGHQRDYSGGGVVSRVCVSGMHHREVNLTDLQEAEVEVTEILPRKSSFSTDE